ncbi:MAG: peptide ABC transporter substrate-binding protein [Roseiflexaceae bacterium]
MSRRIRFQIVIAVVSSVIVLGLMTYLALSRAVVSRPSAGGSYIEGVVGLPTSLNPLIGDTGRDLAAADVQTLIFDGLVRINLDGTPGPGLAESWEIDETGMVYTFTLRSDVQWHDGEPLDVEDVLFTLRAIQGPAFTGAPSVATVWRTVLVERAGDRSIRCQLQAPFAPFLKFATVPILPAHLLSDVPPEQWASSQFSMKPIGTGPYRLDQLNSEGIVLRANANYYQGRPLIENITLRFYPDEATAFAALTRGEINGMAYLGTGNLGSYNVPRGVTRRVVPIDAYTILTFNLQQAPFNDPVFRRQLAQAIDRDDMINRVFTGQVARVDTPILPGWWAYDPTAVWYIPSKERAAAGLESLGYRLGDDGVRVNADGQRLEFELFVDGAVDRNLAAADIVNQLRQVGVNVIITPLDGDVLRQRLESNEFQMALHGWQRLGSDPDVYELWHSTQAGIGRNYAGLQDALIDDALSLARIERSRDVRSELYAEFQHRWIDLAPSIIMYQPYEVYATISDLGGTAITRKTDMPGMMSLLFGRESRFRNVVYWYVSRSREISGDIQP